MPDFSPSGIYGLPAITADTLRLGGDPRVLGWLTEAVQEGDIINRDDPVYDQADKGMRYIIGEQKDREQLTLQYLPFAVINMSRKAVQAHVSALTDIKPVFGFKAMNPKFSYQSDLMNRLVVAWWLESMADITLGDTIKYALGGGTADLALEWDPGGAQGLGDHRIIAKDFRDTLPIRPSTDPSPQLWQGVTFREAHPINAMRAKYPTYMNSFRPAPDTLLSTVMSKFRRVVTRLMTPAADTLSGLAGVPQARPVRPGDVVTYRTYLNDHTRNLTNKPIVMGDPTANWSYVVEPGGLLYPQKRCIVSTPELILYDGPNPYWHSMYPFARLKLWSVPWCFLGLPLLNDTIPIQDAINDTMKDLRLAIKQWVDPDIVFDKNSVSAAFRQAMDPRRPGKKVAINALGAPSKEPWKKQEGPNPQVMALMLEVFNKLEQIHDNMTGVANLTALMQLRQMPGADTIEKYYEALTPELRQEGRMMEAFLRDIAYMYKFNIFQFMNSTRRVNILGDAGVALEDFDYDPDTLVPSMEPMEQQPITDPMTGAPAVDPLTGQPAMQMVPNPQYIPELDSKKSRVERAKYMARMFVFTVAPNSILAMNAQEKRMMNFQLARMGYLDFWSLHESLETPNIGNPPPIPLPVLQPPTDEMELAQGIAMGKYIPGPTGLMEVRTPMTVTERLIAQQMMGIGMTENPAGRKASGEEAPKQETKTDEQGAPRTTTTESQK